MKKYFYSVFAALSILFAATSCSQDEELVSNVEGLKQTVTLKVSTPGAAQTRAVAVDGKNANVGEGNAADHLIYALYEKAPDGTLYQSDNHQSGALYQAVAEERFDGVFEVKLDLVRDLTYEIMFLAYNENNCAFDFTDPENVDLRALTLKTGDALKANQESYDAFVNSIEHVVNTEAVTYVTLKRPFAQINAATTQQDLENANLLEADVRETQLVIENVPTVYNVFTGEASAPQTVTYTRSAILSKVGAAEPYINEDIKVADEPYKYLTLAYVLAGETADAEKSMHNATFTFYRTNGKTPDCVRTIEIQNLPIQRNYRTNVVGSLITKAEDFRIEIDDKFEGDHDVDAVNDSEDFEKALRVDKEHIVVELPKAAAAHTRAAGSQEYLLNISSTVEKYYLGGASTKTITINANGNTINFVHNDGDWNYISCVNEDCKLYINDAHLTNSGKNDGPWNRHDIRFNNAVELNNVTSDKAIALLNDGTLTNVQITEDGEVYGLWITAQGQTVNIDGLNVVATNSGRAIKIADQYVDSPEKVTLNMKNAKFETAKKAAILVSSVAGADITLEKIDLSKVAADKFNAVWVDEEWAEYFDLTSVEGGFVVLESNTPANPFAEDNAVVTVPAGTYGSFPAVTGKNVTIKADGAVFNGTSGLNINGATVEGATFSNSKGTSVSGTINGTFKDCTFTGSNGLRWCYAGETTVFENCAFDGGVYGVHFDGGENPVTFKNCTFSGFNAFAGAIALITFEDCTFKANGRSSYNGANLWGNTKMIRTNFVFDGKASTEWIGINGAGSKSYEFTECTVPNNGNIFKYLANYSDGYKVTVDGEEYVVVETADGLKNAISEDATTNNILLDGTNPFEGKFVPRKTGLKLMSMDSANKAVIKGRVNIDGYSDGIVFENIKFEINDESKVKNSFTGAQYKYPGIVVIYATAASFEGCEFKSDLASGVCGINYGAHAEGKVLNVNNCHFEGDFYAVRTRTNFSITNSTFDVYTTEGTLAAVWTWGNGNTWENNITFKNNKNINENKIYGVQLGSTNFAYNNINVDVQGNTNFYKLEEAVNSKCSFSDITFAEGSETFTF